MVKTSFLVGVLGHPYHARNGFPSSPRNGFMKCNLTMAMARIAILCLNIPSLPRVASYHQRFHKILLIKKLIDLIELVIYSI
jgi:hypothetical protein